LEKKNVAMISRACQLVMCLELGKGKKMKS